MADAGKTVRKSTTGSALVLCVLVIAMIAIVAYIAMNPDILKDILNVVIAAIIILVIIAVIIFLIVTVLAVPYYAIKGEETQTDATYDLSDVKSVKEKIDDDEKKDDNKPDTDKKKDDEWLV